LRGRLADAAATAASARPGPLAASCAAELAYALALSGDGDGAVRALQRARNIPSLRYVMPEQQRIALAEPLVTAANGDLKTAVNQTVAHADNALSRGAVTFAVLALFHAARLGAASAVHRRLRVLVTETQGDLPRLFADFADAVANRDTSALVHASEAFELMGYLLYAAEAAALGASHATSTRTAAHARTTALRLAARCQHARTPALEPLEALELTHRERETARLAAAGLTNVDIARRLTLSTRTVENHLQHAYTTLGITSRSQLPSELGR
jgi:DNA-binding CsgD family transcriptional regulator